MMTLRCRNCGDVKQSPREYPDPHCSTCATTDRDTQKAFAAANPDATDAQIIHAGRQALLARAHHAHRNFVDPRAHAAQRGMPSEDRRGDMRGR